MIMNHTFFKKAGVFALILNMLAVGFPQVSFAGLVGTGTALEMQAKEEDSARIDAFLARDDVRAQLIAMGVDPAAASARVAMLTEAERQQLEQQIDNLPAGGSLLALIGAVFVVLLILELVGVINIFQKI
jgi:hypothetical protein